MELANVHTPTRWRSLLWKDLQLTKSTIIAVTLGLLAVQLCFVAWGFLQSGQRGIPQSVLEASSIIVYVGPILVAIGCSGMLIGQERQAGTWNWQSALPLSWRESLFSKLLITLLSAGASAISLSVIPLLLIFTLRMKLAEHDSVVSVYATSYSLIIFFEVVCFCYLASLIVRETLSALVLAALSLLFGQSILIAFVLHIFENATGSTGESKIVAWLAAAVLGIGCIGMAWAYRWRWRLGQFSEMAFWRQSTTDVAQISERFRYASEFAPSQWQILLWFSLRNSLGLRLVIVIGILLLLLMFANSPAAPSVLLVLLAMGLLGLTTFEGDRSLNRFQFLADRGVGPKLLVGCRLIGAGVWSFVFLVLSMLVDYPHINNNDLWVLVALLPIAFLIPALLSMGFSKPVFAGVVAFVIAVGGLTLLAIVIETTSINSGVFRPFDIAMYLAPVAWIILVATVFGLARRWLVLDDARVPLIALGIAIFTVLFPSVVLVYFFEFVV